MVPLVKATRLTPVAKVSHLDALGAAPAVAGAVELHGAGARPVPYLRQALGRARSLTFPQLPRPSCLRRPPSRPSRALLVPMAAVKGAAW